MQKSTHRPPTEDPKLRQLEESLAAAAAGGGPERIAKQHAAGKLTARERVALLLDPGSFLEFDAFVTHGCRDFGMDRQQVPGDGVITGHGRIEGRSVYLYAQDFTVFGGSVSEVGARKICKVIELAMDNGDPVISLNDGSGARLQEGIASLGGYAEIGRRVIDASGVVPQISAIMGPCAGGAAYTPSICDFIFMVENTSFMFVTGPEVITHATGEHVSKEALGGANTHFTRTGIAHFKSRDDTECLAGIRRLLSYLPSNYREKPKRTEADQNVGRDLDEIEDLVPSDPKKPYDVLRLIEAIVDEGTFLEVQAGWARSLVVGFARIDGWAVGMVANQPRHLAGVLDIDASLKCARFVRFCDAFNLPILTLLDTPGYLPGTQQEFGGIIRHGAKLGFAYAEATVPKITLVMRKAYGGAYGAMGSKHVGTDINLAYPGAEIAVMASEGAARILFAREIAAAGERAEEVYAERVRELQTKLLNPYVAAQKGYVDAIIRPRQTRRRIAHALWQLSEKRVRARAKKHSNIPL